MFLLPKSFQNSKGLLLAHAELQWKTRPNAIIHHLIFFLFSDQEASSEPHQAAYERFYGVVPAAEEADYRQEPRCT